VEQRRSAPVFIPGKLLNWRTGSSIPSEVQTLPLTETGGWLTARAAIRRG